MPARKLPKDYHELAESRGIKWLGPEVPNNKTKTGWECSLWHQWKAVYGNIGSGRGCPYCAGVVRKTFRDYHVLAKEKGFRWLGLEFPTNTHVKTDWECQEGHQWQAPYHYIQQGSGCPHCAGWTSKTEDDYCTLAAQRGFKWIGSLPRNTHYKTHWECGKGHTWSMSYHKLAGCPDCYFDSLRKKPIDYHALANVSGFQWLGPEVSNNATKTTWGCGNGHQWESTYGNIRAGWGCPTCSQSVPKIPEDYHVLAKERDFRWLGPAVSNTATKTGWECQKGHQWEARYNNILRGNGCPICIDRINGSNVSRVQRQLCEMVVGVLNYPCGRYRIDVALPTEMIAVEYDSWYWHGDRLEDDAERDRKLLSAGWKILHIKSNNELPPQHQLESALDYLRNGEALTEIILRDWGKGTVFVRAEHEKISCQ